MVTAMARLLDDLLDTSRITCSAIEFEVIDLLPPDRPSLSPARWLHLLEAFLVAQPHERETLASCINSLRGSRRRDHQKDAATG